MPEVVTCPKCQKKARVPDALVGKKVKCPGCGEPFVAKLTPAAPPEEDDEDPGFEVVDEPKEAPKPARSTDKVSTRPAANRKTSPARAKDEDDRPRRPARRTAEDDDDDDEDDRPRRRSRADDYDDDDEDDRPRKKKKVRADWSRVHKGLSFILYAIITAFAGMLILVVLGMILGAAGAASLRGGGGPRAAGGVLAGAAIIGIIGIAIQLAYLVLMIMGLVFTLPSPVENGSKTLATVSLSLFGGFLACQLLSILLGVIGGASGAPGALVIGNGISILGYVLVFAWSLAFIFYLRSLALNLRDKALASNWIRYLIANAITTVVLVILIVIMGVFMLGGAAGMASQMNRPNANPGGFGAMMGGGMIGMCVVWLIAILAGLGLGIWGLILFLQTRTLVGTRA